MKKLLIVFALLLPAFSQAVNYETMEANEQIEAQVQGNYPAINRKESLPLGMIQTSWAKAPLTKGIREVAFQAGERIEVIVREYMTTEISFPSWEAIDEEAIVLGDNDTFATKLIRSNVLSIRASRIGVDTSLKVIGNSGHIYAFYLVSHGYNSKRIPDLHLSIRAHAPKYPVVNGEYLTPRAIVAQQDAASREQEKPQDYLQKVSINPENIDFDFTMFGAREIAPQFIYTDGRQTWFDYSHLTQRGQLPVIAALIDGVETPINVRRDAKDRLVADYAGHFSLKHGKKNVCVFYKSVPKHMKKANKVQHS